jgi:hypothetical protein
MIITMKEEDLRAILETFKLTPQEIDRMLDDIRLPEGHTLTADDFETVEDFGRTTP